MALKWCGHNVRPVTFLGGPIHVISENKAVYEELFIRSLFNLVNDPSFVPSDGQGVRPGQGGGHFNVPWMVDLQMAMNILRVNSRSAGSSLIW